VLYADSIAKDIGIFPNLEKYEKDNPEFYRMLFYGPALFDHYLLEHSDETVRKEACERIKKINQDLNTVRC